MWQKFPRIWFWVGSFRSALALDETNDARPQAEALEKFDFLPLIVAHRLFRLFDFDELSVRDPSATTIAGIKKEIRRSESIAASGIGMSRQNGLETFRPAYFQERIQNRWVGHRTRFDRIFVSEREDAVAESYLG